MSAEEKVESTQPDLTSIHVRQAASGNADSLNWLVSRFTPALLAQAAHRMGPRLRHLYDPDDVVSDVWAVALPRLAGLPAREGRFTPVFMKFLSTTLLNRVNNLVQKHIQARREGRDVAADGSDDPLAGLPAEMTGVVTRVVRGENHAVVMSVLESLAEDERAIVVMRAVEQRSAKEVADELGILPNTVTVKYRRALEKLREKLPDSVFGELKAD
jgi:RNA polymerase sigma factor (sigma-70 family)